MPIASPVPGLVVRCNYLWLAEFMAGRDMGVKDRPAVIVAAVLRGQNGATRVLVLPITHAPPNKKAAAIEIPARARQRLGLDDAPSWIVV